MQRLSDVAAQQQLAAREAERAKAAEAASRAFVWPTAGGVSSGFGYRVHPILTTRKLHNGADIGGACGQPIVAVPSGIVTRAERSGSNGGVGHNVRIDHGPVGGAALETAYLHMDDVAVKVDQRVETGQTVGHGGLDGFVDGLPPPSQPLQGRCGQRPARLRHEGAAILTEPEPGPDGDS